MNTFDELNGKHISSSDGSISLRDYKRKERQLEETCRQFEGQMFSKIWKDMMKSARTIGGKEEEKRQYAPLEDTVVEMVSEHLSEQQGVGLWKVLYDSLHKQLPKPAELQQEQGEKGNVAAGAAMVKKHGE